MGLGSFDWRQISEYIKPENRGHHQHIEDPQTRLQVQHFQQILKRLEKQKFYTLAEPVRHLSLDQKEPLTEEEQSSVLDEPKSGSRWNRTPWFFRRSFEAVAIAGTVMGLVIALPKALNIYESHMQKQLDTFDLADILTPGTNKQRSPEELNQEMAKMIYQKDRFGSSNLEREIKTSDPTLDHEIEKITAVSELDLAKLKAEEGFEEINFEKLKVGHYERWRFDIKTDAPAQLRPNVIELLREVGLGESTKGFRGKIVPGGVKFEIVVKRDLVIPIMKGIVELAKNVSGGSLGKSFKTFTWYRTKARGRRLKRGVTQIQIWLAQI